MARATNKADLIAAANAQFQKLWKLIDRMDETKQNAAFAFEDRDKNLRDVLVHLFEWHQMVSRWHREGTVQGGMPAVPGEGYTWKTLPALNLHIWKQYQSVPLPQAKIMLHQSHAMILKLIESHSDEELFAKNMYKWTKTSTLGAYFVSCTASHYEWAMTKLKKHIKAV